MALYTSQGPHHGGVYERMVGVAKSVKLIRCKIFFSSLKLSNLNCQTN